MTYSQIFRDIYYEKKKLILTYITLCLVFSVLAFGNSTSVSAYSTAQTVRILGGSFGAVVAPIAQTFLGGIDTPSAMLILSAISFGLDVLPTEVLQNTGDFLGMEGLEGLADYSFGILDHNFFRLFFLAWFVLSKLSRSNRVTYTLGTILEDLEVKFGAAVHFLTVASQIFSNIPLGNTALAASAVPQSDSGSVYGFDALLCFLLLVLIMVIYVFIRCLFFFFDIVLLPVCTLIPFVASLVETAKTLSIVILTFLAAFHPLLFFVLFIITLIAAIVLFKKAYISIRYFKQIYTKPFFKKITGYDSTIPLVSPKVPKKVLQFVNDNAEIIIPVFLLKKIPEHKCASRHSRWWFVITESKCYICKPLFMQNTCYCIEFGTDMVENMFIKKSLRFFEIFDIKGDKENLGKLFHKVPKNIHFVFSKEYTHRFEQIKQLTTFTDYSQYKEEHHVKKPKKAFV